MAERQKKRAIGRPRTGKGKRPVLSMRIHPDLYDDICRSAKKRRLSISEEATRRLEVQRLNESSELDRIKPMIRDAVATGIDNYIKNQKRENRRPSWV